MITQIDRKLGDFLAAWVDAVRRRSIWVAIGMPLVALLGLWFAVDHLEVKGDTEGLFSADLPFKRNERRYFDAFPAQYDPLFIVIDAATPERAGEAARLLVERLENERDVFRSVYLPGGGEFFEKNAYLYLDLDELEELTSRIVAAQPYLAELSRDGSLRSLASIMARGARAYADGDVSGGQLEEIFDQCAAALRARIENLPFHLSWSEVVVAETLEGDQRRRFLIAEPARGDGDLGRSDGLITTVRRVVEESGFSEDVRVRLTGEAALRFEETVAVRRQATMAGVASFLLVGALLFLALRSVRMVVATLATLLIGLVFTANFTAVAVGHFNLISVSFAVLFIGLGVDFGIHLCMRYREFSGQGSDHADALRKTARDVGSSIALCAVTTAIGFFAFVPTDFIGVAELGLISGAGMLISFFCTLTFLPALLSLSPPSQPVGRHARTAWSGALVELPVRYPRFVRATAMILAAGAVVMLPEARFDNDPLNVRDPSSESVRTLNDLLADSRTSPWSLNALAPDLESAEELATRMRSLDTVDHVVTLADFVPDDQQEKLEIIEDVSLFLEPLPAPEGGVTTPTTAEQIESLRVLERELDRLLGAEEVDDSMRESAAALREDLERYLESLEETNSAAESLDILEQSLLGSLPEQLRILDAASQASRVTLDDLPDKLTDQMLASDGRVRVQIFPRDDLKDHAALARFVDTVRSIDPDIAGSAAEIVASGRTVVAALRQALLSALVAVTLLLLFIWRRATDASLVLIPLVLASALTVAAAVLLDIPFNFADVIVLPLLLGIGVDSGIHLVHRARISGDPTSNLLGTSTARAVAFSAFTTIASFGTLGLATHRGMATLGQLLTLGVCITLLCNLVVLPALIALQPGLDKNSGDRPAG